MTQFIYVLFQTHSSLSDFSLHQFYVLPMVLSYSHRPRALKKEQELDGADEHSGGKDGDN